MSVSAKERAVIFSILLSLTLAAAKLAVGLATGSLAILTDAAQTVLDLGTSGITWFAVRIGDKPADHDHHFGHAKVESVAALVETAILLGTAVFFVIEAVKRLLGGGDPPESIDWWVGAVFVVSIIADLIRVALLRRVAKATGSQALEADALNFSTDIFASVFVLIGIGGVALGFPAADALAAIVIAGFIAVNGIGLARRTIATLVDTAPAGVVERITEIAEATDGVLSVDMIRARPSGAQLFVDAHVTARRTLPFDRVDGIKRHFADAIGAEFAGADVTVTVRPVALDDETVFERVMLIAARRGVAVHHVVVQHLTRPDEAGWEGLSISLDLEVDGALPLGEAHSVASGLERAIRSELGDEVEVESHIEPMQVSGLDARDAGAVTRMRFAEILREVAAEVSALSDVHDVRVRVNDEGLFVNCHCFVDAGLSVDAVHDAVDAFERGFRRRVPEVRRLVVHAEPRG